MGNSSIDKKELKAAIRQVVFYKYIFLLLGIGAAAFVGYSSSVEHYIGERSHIARELLSGILAALLISLVYDRGVKKQEELQRRLEQDDLRLSLSRQALLGNLRSLGDDEVLKLSQRIIKDRRFRDCIIGETAALGGNFGKRATAAILHGLWDQTKPKLKSWQIRLLKNGADSSSYLLEYTQKFEYIQKLEQRPESSVFRVLLTERAFVGPNIMSVSDRFDGAIAVPELKLTQEIADRFTQLSHHRLKISFDDVSIEDITLPAPKLSRYPRKDNNGPDLGKSDVWVLEFQLPVNDWQNKGRVLIEWYWNSVSSIMEPFCFVQADELMFAGDFTVEYSQVAERLGKVWVAGFIGGEGREIHHDEDRKQVRVVVNGPMMPGQGIALVWNPRPAGGRR